MMVRSRRQRWMQYPDTPSAAAAAALVDLTGHPKPHSSSHTTQLSYLLPAWPAQLLNEPTTVHQVKCDVERQLGGLKTQGLLLLRIAQLASSPHCTCSAACCTTKQCAITSAPPVQRETTIVLQRTDIPATQQALLFAGQELPDEALVEEQLGLDKYNTRAEVGVFPALCRCTAAKRNNFGACFAWKLELIVNGPTSTNTNNQQPTTNNQQPTANNQQPTTNNQQPTTNNQQPTTNNQQPNQQPTTNNQQPTTNNQQPTTNNQQPTTNNQYTT